MNTQRGFTLIEMVAVIIILSVASVPLFGMFTQASLSLADNENIQTAAQLAQERAEAILAVRRDQGYGAAALAPGTYPETFPVAGNYAAYTRSTVISQPPVGPGCPLHPVTLVPATCKEVVISVSRNGRTHAQLGFLLVNY